MRAPPLLSDAAFVIGPHGRPLLVALAWTLCSAALLTLINPLLTRWIFDVAVPARRITLLLGVSGCALVVFTALRWLDYHYALYQQRLTNRMTTSVSRVMLMAYFRLPPAQVARESEGYFVARTMTEVQDVVAPLIATLIGLLRSGTIFVTALSAVLLLSWPLTLALLGVTPVLLLLSRHFAARLHVNAQEVQESAAQQQAVHAAAVAAYRATRTFGLEERAAAQVLAALHRRLESVYRLSRQTGLYGTLSRISLSVAEFAVIIAGGLAIIATSLTLGSLMAYMTAFWLAVNAVQSLIGAVPQISLLRAGVQRLRALAEQPVPDEAAPPSRELVWSAVSVGQGDRPVLSDLNLHVPAGSRVLVRGQNGSGKSTLALTLLGLLAPLSGTLEQPAEVSGLVEPVQFPALSLAELLVGSDTDSRTQLTQLLGLDTLMSQPYSALSLGQKKKFAVLITLLKPAQVYVFDEPLANLDAASQQLVFDLILEWTRGRTLVAVMHDVNVRPDVFDLHLQVQGGAVQATVLRLGVAG